MTLYLNGTKILDGVFENGSVTLPSVSFINDLDSGFYNIGADNVGLALNGINSVDFSTTATYFAHGKIGLDSTDYIEMVNNTRVSTYVNGTLSFSVKSGSIEANTINSLNTTLPMSFTSYDNDDVNAVAFSYNAGTALTAVGSKLASLKNAGVEKLYVAYDGTIYLGSSIMRSTSMYGLTMYHGSGGLQNATTTEGTLIKGRIPDGGANPAVITDNSALLTTAGNKLLSIRNAGSEKAHVDYLGSYSQSGLTTKKSSETVADDGTIALPTGVSGWGEVQIGDDQEYAYFSVKVDGTVLLRMNSANVVNTDSDGNLCIYDGGTGAVIKNRLGSSLTVRYTFNYS